MAVADNVRDAIAPLLAARDLELYDVEHTGGVLRVVVDAEGGVDLEALSEATRAVSRLLDELDPIGGRYTLEVTSPGLERTLRTRAHFARAVGSTVKIRTHPGVEGERRATGELVDATDDGIVVRLRDPAPGEDPERSIGYDQIERAQTVFEWGTATDEKKARTP